MRLQKLHIQTRFKNIENLEMDFADHNGLTVFIGNNGSGKSNLLEALSSIFSGLYNQSRSPSFGYQITYKIENKAIQIAYKVDGNVYKLSVDGVEDNIKPEYLPSRVIANYSGEESRLWDTYYKPFYDDYIQAIKGASLPSLELMFVNRYYWDIALLTLHYYDFLVYSGIKNFCENELGITQVGSIQLNFDTKNLATYKQNPVVNFVKAINPKNESTLTLTLAELKGRVSFVTNEREFFNYLTAAFMPKDSKLITNISFNFNQNLTTHCLSEGEKKLILVMLILEVIGDENALILLDEPDSHIHISRKQDLQKLIAEYSNRQNIITTHSPTLTHCFENKNIVMLSKSTTNDASIVQKEKQDIVYELTNGIWSYQEQNIFLSSDSDILLVEGKSDIAIIGEAIKKLDEPNYKPLEKLEFVPTGGASAMCLFIGKFTPKTNQKIIAILDNDMAGNDAVKELLSKAMLKTLEKDGFVKIENLQNTYLLKLPKLDRITDNQYEIEDYLPISRMVGIATSEIQTYKVLKNFALSKNMIKRKLNKEVGGYLKADFEDFRVLFDLILRIKTI